MVSGRVAQKETLGVFENAFNLSNYECSLKRPYKEESGSQDADEDQDERSKRVFKRINKYSISVEDQSLL